MRPSRVGMVHIAVTVRACVRPCARAPPVSINEDHSRAGGAACRRLCRAPPPNQKLAATMNRRRPPPHYRPPCLPDMPAAAAQPEAACTTRLAPAPATAIRPVYFTSLITDYRCRNSFHCFLSICALQNICVAVLSINIIMCIRTYMQSGPCLLNLVLDPNIVICALTS